MINPVDHRALLLLGVKSHLFDELEIGLRLSLKHIHNLLSLQLLIVGFFYLIPDSARGSFKILSLFIFLVLLVCSLTEHDLMLGFCQLVVLDPGRALVLAP